MSWRRFECLFDQYKDLLYQGKGQVNFLLLSEKYALDPIEHLRIFDDSNRISESDSFGSNVHKEKSATNSQNIILWFGMRSRVGMCSDCATCMLTF